MSVNNLNEIEMAKCTEKSKIKLQGVNVKYFFIQKGESGSKPAAASLEPLLEIIWGELFGSTHWCAALLEMLTSDKKGDCTEEEE